MKTIKGRKVYTVSEINYFAKETLEQMSVWIEGEVSEIRKHASLSFYYLTLKDDLAVLPVIASGHLVESLGTEIKNKKVIAFGNLTIYEPYGKYQLRLHRLELAGEGDLYKKLEDLTRKLRSEGLFDPGHKKEIPLYPKKIALITSYNSDAWRDFTTHTVGKFPTITVADIDTRVQGTGAIKSIINALKTSDTKDFDVVVLTRGGGSIEDLHAFNEEEVARAIFKMKTPTIVAIGHEANESLAEWVADIRASTPTDAAHIVTRGWQNALEKIGMFQDKLKSKSEKIIDFNLERLDYIYGRLLSTKSTALRFEEKLISLNHSLNILSPQNTLKRGYSIVSDKNNNVIKTAKSVVVGDLIGVRLARGFLRSTVTEKEND